MNAMSNPWSAQPGDPAPDFKLPLVDGGELWLKQALTHGPVVLAFFKISCPVCQYAFPFYDRLFRLLQPKVAVVGISQDDEQNTAMFRRTLGLSLPIALDGKGYAVSRSYRLTNVPTVIEVSPEPAAGASAAGAVGQITASVVGWSKSETEAIYRRHAAAGGQQEPLFRPGEQVAEFRPG